MFNRVVALLALSAAVSLQAFATVPFTSQTSFDLSLPQNGEFGSTPSVVLADFNGDGILDAATSSRYNVVILLGDGKGSVTLGSYRTMATKPGTIVAGDLNNDGKTDLLVLGQFNPTFTIFLGNGDGTLGLGTEFTSGIQDLITATVGDLNGDGIPDVLLAGYTFSTNGQLQPYLGNGDGTFHAGAVTTVTDTAYCTSVTLGRFHGPDRVDIAAVCGSVYELAGAGDGTFGTLRSLSSTNATSIASGVLSSTGVSDIVYDEPKNSFTSNLVVLRGIGGGDFADPVTYAAPTLLGPLLIADLNNDGALDVVAQAIQSGFFAGAAAYVYPGLGGASFGTPRPVPGSTYANSLAAGDLNGDGHLDLAILGQSSLNIALGDGHLHFTGPALSPLHLTGQGRLVGAVDLNGDGLDDLVYYEFEFAPGVALSNGDGTFTVSAPLPSPRNVTLGAVAVGDIDGDGKADLVCVFNNNSGGGADIYGYGGNGDGTFQSQRLLGTLPKNQFSADTPDSVTVGDVNGDGIADIVVTDVDVDFNQSVRVFFGRGDGSFQPFTTAYSKFTQPYFADVLSTVIADFNGDGVNDIGALLDGELVVLLGTRKGTFVESYAVANNSVQLVTADFNGDGILDLAVSAQHSYEINGTVDIYFGRGNGFFDFQGPVQSGIGTQAAVVADFNHDGYPDIATINFAAGDVTILTNDGQGNFAIDGSWALTVSYLGAVGHFTSGGRIGIAGTNSQVFALIDDLEK